MMRATFIEPFDSPAWCVQFGIPMGMRLFSGVGVNDAIRMNLVPVTMGNITAAVVSVRPIHVLLTDAHVLGALLGSAGSVAC